MPALPRAARGLTSLRWTPAAALSLALAAGVMTAAVADDTIPSEEEIAAAQRDARDKARDVSTVQADLVRANEQLRQSAVAAAQAAEAYNGAVWQAEQARDAARAAADAADAARVDVERQQDTYSQAMVRTYELAPSLQGFAAVVDADGIESVIDRTTTMQNAEQALDGRYDAFRVAATLADVASRQAADAAREAERLEEAAAAARDTAGAAADAAEAQAASIAATKTDLIAELADLQGISVALAEKRQSALERQAQEAAAAAAAQAAAEQAAQEAAQQAAQAAAQEAAEHAAAQEAAAQEAAAQEAAEQQAKDQQAPVPAPSETSIPTPTPTPPPAPTPTPTPVPAPTPAAPPAPSGDAGAALAYAEQQIGDPYRWGATGPDAWDCSGLTAGAWARGGKYLPHYSVAQYTGSAPVKVSQLVPGDLVFWGSSSNPSSIYHVAIYAGGGQIIHAPRTGRPVTRESMYYWQAPNFFARP